MNVHEIDSLLPAGSYYFSGNEAATAYADMPREKAKVDPKTCNNCGRCLKACFYDAMQPGSKYTWVQEDNCIGCGGCYSVCPVDGAIHISIQQ
jgi:MinD superfamily P-loop ATPase